MAAILTIAVTAIAGIAAALLAVFALVATVDPDAGGRVTEALRLGSGEP